MQLTLKKIRSWHPCYDPGKYFPEDWCGDAVDVLKHPGIPYADKFWVLRQELLLPQRVIQEFLIWNARQFKQTNPVALKAISIAERIVAGEDLHAKALDLDMDLCLLIRQADKDQQPALRAAQYTVYWNCKRVVSCAAYCNNDKELEAKKLAKLIELCHEKNPL